MSRRIVIGVFASGNSVVAATRALRTEGLTVQDVFTPYAVHGLDEALGLEPSRLSRLCFVLGLTGAVLATWFCFWTNVVDWPLNVGGRPWNSLAAFTPVIFEVMVLSAGVGTAVAFFAARRLYPGKAVLAPIGGTTNDRFAIVLDGDGPVDRSHLRARLEGLGAVDVEEREVRGRP